MEETYNSITKMNFFSLCCAVKLIMLFFLTCFTSPLSLGAYIVSFEKKWSLLEG